MLPRRWSLSFFLASLALFGFARGLPNLGADESPSVQPLAERILAAAGVKGGIIVHLGCGDGRLTAALRASDAFTIHGLERDPALVKAARESHRQVGTVRPGGRRALDRHDAAVRRQSGQSGRGQRSVVRGANGDHARPGAGRRGSLFNDGQRTTDHGHHRSSRVPTRSTSGRTSCTTRATTPWPATPRSVRRAACSGSRRRCGCAATRRPRASRDWSRPAAASSTSWTRG